MLAPAESGRTPEAREVDQLHHRAVLHAGPAAALGAPRRLEAGLDHDHDRALGLIVDGEDVHVGTMSAQRSPSSLQSMASISDVVS